MIYKNPNSSFNESISLFGVDADEFLESISVELYSDHITINEMPMDGCTGENILAENGIFLYEDGIVLEGEQAEEYKARKAKERKDAKKIEIDRKERRYGYKTKASSNGKRYYTYNTSMSGKTGSNNASDKERSSDVNNKMTSIENKRRFEAERLANSDTEYGKNARAAYTNFMKNKPEAADALNRRYRRHPKTNSAKTLRDRMRATERHYNDAKPTNTNSGYDYSTKNDDTYEYPNNSRIVTSKGNKLVTNKKYSYWEQSIISSIKIV